MKWSSDRERWSLELTLYANDYNIRLGLGFGDSDLGCGENCGKVEKRWGFAWAWVVEKFV